MRCEYLVEDTRAFLYEIFDSQYTFQPIQGG